MKNYPRGHSGNPLPKGKAPEWVSRVHRCQFDSVHAGLVSAVPMSYAGSTSLELKSSDDSQHRLTCVDIGQTGNVLCGLSVDNAKGVNEDDSYIATMNSNSGAKSVIAGIDWKFLRLLKKRQKKHENRRMDCQEHKPMKNNLLLQINKQKACRRHIYRNKNGTKAVLEESIQVHVLNKEQLKNLADKNTMIITLSCPVRDESKNIFWKIDATTEIFKEGIDISKKNIALVCHYAAIKHDQKLCFVGAFKKKPCDEDMILLGLILQNYKKKAVKKMNIQKIFKQCSMIKKPINDSVNAKHHESVGSIFGFGSRKDTNISEETRASVKKYCFKDGKKERKMKIFLEEKLKKRMTEARMYIKDFVKSDLISVNSAQLKTDVQLATKAGFGADFEMMGDSGYASLFFNIDASTLQKHTKEDWNMTTLYVPEQDWGSKDSNHLQFWFHLSSGKNGILKIPMQPGTIIYFSGYLLTHQQMHNGGLCSKHGCCLNLSAYANKKLQTHCIKSLIRCQNN